MRINNAERKKAILLHFAGPEVHDIFDTIITPAPAEGEDTPNVYQVCINALNDYFIPQANVTFNTYKFRQMKQEQGESLDEFYARLKHQATLCAFDDRLDTEVKGQIIMGCNNAHLRRKELENNGMELATLIAKGKAMEQTEAQAAEIEAPNSASTNAIRGHKDRWTGKKNKHSPPPQPPRQRPPQQQRPRQQHRQQQPGHQRGPNKSCGLCGGSYPHRNGPTSCPAHGRTCNKCGKQNLRQSLQIHKTAKRQRPLHLRDGINIRV